MTQELNAIAQDQRPFYSLVPWVLGLLLALTLLFFMRADLLVQERLWQNHLEVKTQAQSRYLNDMHWEQNRHTLFLAQAIAKDEAVLDAMSKAYRAYLQVERVSHHDSVQVAREKLHKQLIPYWRSMTGLGISQMNIYFTPGNIAFLRMDKPGSYGDSTSAVRSQINEAIAHKKASTKITVASEGSGYRAIVPLAITDIESSKELQKNSDLANNNIDVLIEVFMPSFAMTQVGTDASIQAAIFLHRQLVEGALSAQTRKQLDEISLLRRDDWHLEKTTDSLLYSWWNQGIVPIGKQGELLHSVDKVYVTSWRTEKDDADRWVAGIAQFAWTEVTQEYKNYLSIHRGVMVKWISSLIVALVFIYLLVLFQRYKIEKLHNVYTQAVDSDQSATEQALNRMRLALRSGESGTWEWNIQYQTAKFSPEWRVLCGLGPESPHSLDLDEWLNRMHPADKHSSYSELVRHMKGEIPIYENEYRLRTNDGTYRWILARGRVVEWQSDGKAAVMTGVYYDITDRKQAELNSIRHQTVLRALNEIANLPRGNLVQQMRSALAIAAKYLALTEGMVAELDGNYCKIKAHYSEDSINQEQESMLLESSYVGLILTKRELFAEDNIAKSEYSKHLAYVHTQIESCIGIPLWVEGRLFGTLSFNASNSRQYAYDSVDKDFVKLLAYWIGLTMEYYQQINNRKEIINRFDKLTERLPGFIYQYQESNDGHSFFPYASMGIKTLFNLSPEVAAVSATQFFKSIHADDQTWVRNTLSYSATHLTPWVATARIMSVKQGLIWVHFESVPEKLADGNVVWYGYASDITAFKKLEAEMQGKNVKHLKDG